jgi:hypothetical protein
MRGEMGCGVLGQKGRVKGLGFCLFFSKPFSNLLNLTFQTFEIELFSKHSKIFKTFLKSFKTS